MKQYNRKRVGSENARLTVKRQHTVWHIPMAWRKRLHAAPRRQYMAICMCLTMEEGLTKSFLHAALRFRVWVGRRSKKTGRFYAFRRGYKICMNGMYRENALGCKTNMFCTYHLTQVALALVAAVKDATIASTFCGKAYKSCINGNIYVYKEEPRCIKGGLFEEN